MFATIAIVFGAVLLLCAVKAKKTGQQVSLIKPARAQAGMIAGAAFLALGVGILGAGSGGPSQGAAVTEVLLTIPNSDKQVSHYQTAPLADGVAVVVNDYAGYWVKDGKAYAVNGIAKNMSPGISYSPDGIDWRKVELAVK